MNSDKEKISGFLEMGGIIGRKAKKAHRNFWKWWIRSWSWADGLTNVYKFQNSLNCVVYICAFYILSLSLFLSLSLSIYIHSMLILLCKAVKKTMQTLSWRRIAWTMQNKKKWEKKQCTGLEIFLWKILKSREAVMGKGSFTFNYLLISFPDVSQNSAKSITISM